MLKEPMATPTEAIAGYYNTLAITRAIAAARLPCLPATSLCSNFQSHGRTARQVEGRQRFHPERRTQEVAWNGREKATPLREATRWGSPRNGQKKAPANHPHGSAPPTAARHAGCGRARSHEAIQHRAPRRRAVPTERQRIPALASRRRRHGHRARSRQRNHARTQTSEQQQKQSTDERTYPEAAGDSSQGRGRHGHAGRVALCPNSRSFESRDGGRRAAEERGAERKGEAVYKPGQRRGEESDGSGRAGGPDLLGAVGGLRQAEDLPLAAALLP